MEVTGEVTANPFVGPRPLGPGDPIFGRDREIRELRRLLSAERIVLLCSPSGAGKSSLISAGLIPELRDRFDVWLPTRVSLKPEDGIHAANRYVWSAAVGFEEEVPERLRRSPESFAASSLAEYVKGRPRRPDAPESIVLVFDQFEEILRTDPVDEKGRREFFRQLGDLLTDPNIWALFALREDFLAPLDRYCATLPTHLRYRYRIDLLGPEAAADAMEKTAKLGFETNSRKPLQADAFARDAMEKLVTDLSANSLYIEPLQLQVVCRGLWDRLPPGTSHISNEQVSEFANVTGALANYYAGKMTEIAAGDLARERALRDWIEAKLIARDGARGLARLGEGQGWEPDGRLIQEVVDTHLVRAEQRAGAIWYELAHDRLVEPVRKDNAAWRDKHLAHVQKVATLWTDQDKPSGLLMTGAALREARRWAKQNPEAVTSVETEFLEASGAKNRTRQILQAGVLVMAVLLIALAIATWWAYRQTKQSRSRELAAKADSAFRSISPMDKLDGLILALGALYAWDTPEAMTALDLAWQENQGAKFTGHTADITALRWSADGKNLVSGDANGQVILWDTSTGQQIKALLPASNGLGVEGIDFRSDGAVAVAADDGAVRVVNASTPSPVPACAKPPAMDVAFGANGTTLGVACGDGTAVLSQSSRVLGGHSGAVNTIRFAPAERLVATGGDDGLVILHSIDTGNTVARWDNQGKVTALQFSRDGKWLAGTRLDKAAGRLFVWNAQKKVRQFETVANGDGAFSVDFSSDGSLIATGGLNGDVILWTADKGQQYLTLFNAGCDPGGDCRARVAFDPTSKRIAIASGDKIWLHDLDLTSVRQQAIAKLTKNRPEIQDDCRRILQSACPGF